MTMLYWIGLIVGGGLLLVFAMVDLAARLWQMRRVQAVVRVGIARRA